jgi:hypothetical protein
MSYRVTALLLLITLPLAAATGLAAARSSEEEVPDDIKAAHEKLREALKEIRGYHGTGAYAGVLPFGDADFEYTDFNRVRIGVIVESHSDGARITGVTPGSPADEAGLLSGDIITHINDEPITDDRRHGLRATSNLLRQISRLDDGEEVKITYLRDGKSSETTAVARKMGSEPFFLYSTGSHDTDDQSFYTPPHRLLHSGTGEILLDSWRQPFAWLNMELVALNPELGEYFGADEGVLVIRGPGKNDLDIRAGDVILEIDGRDVKSPSHTMRILRSYESGERLSIELLRHRKELKIETTVPEPRRPSSGLIVDF